MIASDNYLGSETKTLVPGEPGRIIRVRRLILSSNGSSAFTVQFRSEDVSIGPVLRPVGQIDLDFSHSHECIQTSPGAPFVVVTTGLGIAASIWVDYDLVPA